MKQPICLEARIRDKWAYRAIGLGVPPVVITTPPPLVVVPGTSVYYAPDVPANYCFYKGHYYTVANGVWSMAPASNGPWAVIQVSKVPTPILAVPVEYYKIRGFETNLREPM
jgi:hypothetical protein